MKRDSDKLHNQDANSRNNNNARLCRWIQIAACAVGVVPVAILVSIFLSNGAPKAPPEEQTDQPSASQTSEPAPAPSHPTGAAVKSVTPAPTMYSAFQLAPSAGTRQLLESLVNHESPVTEWTEDQKATWKQHFRQLVQQGAEAVPAIREFLAKNVDFDLGRDGKQTFGCNSARGAMIDALAQIGGALAEGAMAEVLKNTGDPTEIAMLAQDLEKLNPGVYQQQALDAARQALQTAAEGGTQNRDVAPLFEVLQKYGGPNVVPELESRINQWEYYAAISLAQLPDGAGVPSLIQLAGDQSPASPGNKAIALQMLAQLATQSPDAQAALLDQVRSGKLTAFNWIGLEPLLAGNELVFEYSALDNPLDRVSVNDVKQTHVPFGNQSFYTVPLGALTIDQVDQRSALINELLSATSDPMGIQMLQKAKAELSLRMSQIAATK
jgi:hypothetical protein